MQCKSLWIKASAKCINVNVNVNNLGSASRRTQRYEKQWMHFVFPGQQRSFASVFVYECFINKAQFDAGFAHRLILKDGAVPAIKDPGHDSEQQTVSETASNVCFVGNRRSSARHSLAPPTVRLQEHDCFLKES